MEEIVFQFNAIKQKFLENKVVKFLNKFTLLELTTFIYIFICLIALIYSLFFTFVNFY